MSLWPSRIGRRIVFAVGTHIVTYFQLEEYGSLDRAATNFWRMLKPASKLCLFDATIRVLEKMRLDTYT